MRNFILKRQLVFVLFVLFGCLNIQAADDLITQQITIKLDEAGTLPDKISSSEKYRITNLKIIGDINGTDVKLLREMAGSNFEIGVNPLGNLSTLDLQDANIVEGGEIYAYEPLAENDHSTHKDKIGMNMFRNCRKLANLILPSNIKEISDYAFIWCNALTHLELPESIVSLSRYALASCGLVTIKIPSSVTSIEEYTFGENIYLKSVSLSPNISKIGADAFKFCCKLQDITIPECVVSIGARAFWHCEKLEKIAVPLSVTSIGERAFSECSGLTSIYVGWKTPLKIDSDVFEKIDKQKCTLFVPQGTLQDYRLADVWGDFENIVEYDPTDINKLTTIKLDEAGTLSDKIRDEEKYKIINLKIIGEINGTDWVLIRDMAGRSVTDEETPGKLSTLDLAEAKIVEGGERYQCLTNNDEIPSRAFLNCKGLDSLILPSNLKSIGYEAFKGCCNLTKLELPSSVTFISDWAFQDCSALNTLVLPVGIKSVENGTFYGCRALTSMVIPSGVTYIGQEAFEKCSSLQKVELPIGLLSIQQYAFQNCSNLQSLTIPSSVCAMGLKCLGGCVGLESIYLCWEDKYAIVSYDNSSNFSNMPYKKCVVYVPSELYDDYRNARWDIWFSMRPYDITGIGKVTTSTDVKEVSRYSVNGQRLATPTKGLNIVKYSDGSVKKVAVQ